jgi:hypothetical protein
MEPPSPSAEDVRSGVLFEDASDNEGPSTIDRHPNLSCVEVFPVNKPPRRKRDSVEGHALSGAEITGTGATSKRRVAVSERKSVASTKPSDSAAAGSSSSNAPAGVSGMAVNPCQIEAPTVTDSNELLDDRKVADIDELYGENERALSNFMKLHPMLSYIIELLECIAFLN